MLNTPNKTAPKRPWGPNMQLKPFMKKKNPAVFISIVICFFYL